MLPEEGTLKYFIFFDIVNCKFSFTDDPVLNHDKPNTELIPAGKVSILASWYHSWASFHKVFQAAL